MHQFDGTMITTALPVMAVSLNEDPLKLNLAITCYLLALAVIVPISGWMADRFGARRVFLAAIAVFTASSVLWLRPLAEIVLCNDAGDRRRDDDAGRPVIGQSVPYQVRAMNCVTIPRCSPADRRSAASSSPIFCRGSSSSTTDGLAGLVLVYLRSRLHEEKCAARPARLRPVGLALAGLCSALPRWAAVPVVIARSAARSAALCSPREANPIRSST
jgi:hypothetical protein